MNSILDALNNYTPKNKKYIEAKNSLLNNAKNFYKGREKIIKGFKDRIFLLNSDDKFEEPKQEEKNIRNKNGLINYDKLMRLIYLKERDISDELVMKHFFVEDLGDLLKKFKELKNNPKNKIRVALINSGLKDLKEEIENMSEKEKETKNPKEIVDILEKILKFNQQNQEGEGSKLLTTNQMLSRFPISLAQLKAGNNSEKLKNEIIQLL